MDDWLTKEDIKKRFKHVSEHTLPFECDVIDVIPQEGTDFSERWTFLKSLFYITDDGYYFQYSDVVPHSVNVKQEGGPFDVYLNGVLRCAYPYAYTSSPGVTIGLIKLILSKGRVYVNRNRHGNLYFVFVGVGYTYLRDSEGGNPTTNTSNVIKSTNKGNISELLNPINKQFDNFSKVGNFWCVKKKNECPQIYEPSTLRLIDISFDKIVYGNYVRENTESSVLESGYDDYFICKNGKWGCLDGEGNIKIDCLYDRIDHFGRYIDEGYVVTNCYRKGFISGKGERIIPCQYDKIEYLTMGGYNLKTLYWAKYAKKISVWDEEGHCLKRDLDECVFIDSCSEGEYDNYRQWDVFWMKKNGIGSIVRGSKFDSINDVVYNKYKGSINYLGEIFMIVAKNNRYGIIDAKGEPLIDYIYENLSFIDNEKLLAYKERKCGVIGLKKIIIPIIYDDLVPVISSGGFVNSYIGVIDGRNRLLDKNGIVLFSNYDYDEVYVEDVYDKDEGFIIIGCHVLNEGKWGFVKQDGRPLIPCNYEEIDTLISKNTIIAFKVRLNGLYGVVDVNNRFLIECKCHELYLFKTETSNFFVYKRCDESEFFAYIEPKKSEIKLKSKQYWQIEKELECMGFGNIIYD